MFQSLSTWIQIEHSHESLLNPGLDRAYPSKTFQKVAGAPYDLWYFTFQSNIILGVTMFLYSLKPKSSVMQSLFFAGLSIIVVTILVYWFSIGPTAPGWKWRNPYWATNIIVVHMVNPGAAYIIFFKNKADFLLNCKTMRYMSLYFFFYLIALFIFFFTSSYVEATPDGKEVFYPCFVYDFLDFSKPFFLPIPLDMFWLAVIIDIAIILISPFALLLLYLLLSKLYRVDVDGNMFDFKFIKEWIKNKFEIKWLRHGKELYYI